MYCSYVLYIVLCIVMMCAIEDRQFEGEAEEPVPEIFEQQDFVPEGKSCP